MVSVLYGLNVLFMMLYFETQGMSLGDAANKGSPLKMFSGSKGMKLLEAVKNVSDEQFVLSKDLVLFAENVVSVSSSEPAKGNNSVRDMWLMKKEFQPGMKGLQSSQSALKSLSSIRWDETTSSTCAVVPQVHSLCLIHCVKLLRDILIVVVLELDDVKNIDTLLSKAQGLLMHDSLRQSVDQHGDDVLLFVRILVSCFKIALKRDAAYHQKFLVSS